MQFTKPDYIADKFHVELCSIIERFHAEVIAKKSPRVIIVAPPQHGKSELVSRRYPAWGLGKSPELHFIACSYSGDWADALCRDVQLCMDADEFHRVFPLVTIPGAHAKRTEAKRLGDYFELASHPGRYKSVGRGGGATGRSAHVLIIDDPLKDAAEAMSETIRQSAWEWYTQVLRTRVQKGGGILLMATRWHEDDLIGRVIEQAQKGGEKWDVHVFPAIAPEDSQDRKAGTALSPSRFDVPDLLAIKGTLSGAAWSALYDGSPVALEGNILPADKWKYYGGQGQPGLPDLRQFDCVVQTWDASFKDAAGSDFCAGQVWGIRGAERWLLDYQLEKMAYPRFKQAIREMTAKWPISSWKLVEDKANGPAVIAELTNEISGMHAVEPAGGKIARAWAASSDLCAGNCFVPDSSIAPWVGDFVRHCSAFPGNINRSGSDDDIDAFTQMVNFVRGYALGLSDFLKQERAKMQNASTLAKPAVNQETEKCEMCQAITIVRMANTKRCNSCGHQWAVQPTSLPGVSRSSLLK